MCAVNCTQTGNPGPVYCLALLQLFHLSTDWLFYPSAGVGVRGSQVLAVITHSRILNSPSQQWPRRCWHRIYALAVALGNNPGCWR